MIPSDPSSESINRDSRDRAAILGIAGGGLLASLAFRLLLVPRLSLSFDESLRWIRLIPLRCPMKFLTGLDCPFCGLGRSLIALVWGDLPRAWNFNPLGPTFALLFLLAVFCYFVSPPRFRATQQRLKRFCRSLHPAWQYGLIAIFIFIFVWKNV